MKKLYIKILQTSPLYVSRVGIVMDEKRACDARSMCGTIGSSE